MNINCNISVGWYYPCQPTIIKPHDYLDVELIEIPPHYRTIKTDYGQRLYSKIPYTQFYITDRKIEDQPVVFITSTLNSIWFESPKLSVLSNCEWEMICWGNIDLSWWFEHKICNDLIDIFWNSTFESGIYEPKFSEVYGESFIKVNAII